MKAKVKKKGHSGISGPRKAAPPKTAKSRRQTRGDRHADDRPMAPTPNRLRGEQVQEKAAHEAVVKPEAKACTDSSTAREERLAALVGEIHEGRLGSMRTAKALAEFAWATGEKLREARKLIGADAFIAWLPQTLGITRREAAAMFNFSRRPKFDASPARDMTLGEALELVAMLCQQYQQWQEPSGAQPKPKVAKPTNKPR